MASRLECNPFESICQNGFTLVEKHSKQHKKPNSAYTHQKLDVVRSKNHFLPLVNYTTTMSRQVTHTNNSQKTDSTRYTTTTS